jgi:hypothetical protein
MAIPVLHVVYVDDRPTYQPSVERSSPAPSSSGGSRGGGGSSGWRWRRRQAGKELILTYLKFMKIKYILSVIAIVALTQNSFAQYSQDAIRFSQTTNGSTSRIKAVGNAGTAVGGDLSNVSGNPAGLGFFTRSEFSITPEFDGSKSKSTYFGQANSASRNTVNLNNAALVIYNQLSKTCRCR